MTGTYANCILTSSQADILKPPIAMELTIGSHTTDVGHEATLSGGG